MSDKWKLFLRKLGIAFVSGALGTFVVSALPILDKLDELAKGEVDFSIILALLISLAAGVFTAGVRAAIAFLTAYVPTDAMYGKNALGTYKKPREVRKAATDLEREAA